MAAVVSRRVDFQQRPKGRFYSVAHALRCPSTDRELFADFVQRHAAVRPVEQNREPYDVTEAFVPHQQFVSIALRMMLAGDN